MKAARGNAFLDLSTSVELINGMSCAEERWYLIYCRYNYTYQLAMVLSGRSLTTKKQQRGSKRWTMGDKRRFPTSARPTQIFALLSVKPTRHANESQRCKADAAIVATLPRLGYFFGDEFQGACITSLYLRWLRKVLAHPCIYYSKVSKIWLMRRELFSKIYKIDVTNDVIANLNDLI